jgi:hypothetical protein
VQGLPADTVEQGAGRVAIDAKEAVDNGVVLAVAVDEAVDDPELLAVTVEEEGVGVQLGDGDGVGVGEAGMQAA